MTWHFRSLPIPVSLFFSFPFLILLLCLFLFARFRFIAAAEAKRLIPSRLFLLNHRQVVTAPRVPVESSRVESNCAWKAVVIFYTKRKPALEQTETEQTWYAPSTFYRHSSRLVLPLSCSFPTHSPLLYYLLSIASRRLFFLFYLFTLSLISSTWRGNSPRGGLSAPSTQSTFTVAS